MKHMKLHEGAGLGAAYGGTHDRRDVMNERTDGETRCVRS